MGELRQRLLSAPRWVLVVVSGIPFGAAMGVMGGLDRGSWTQGLIEGAITGVAYGLLMGVVLRRQFGRYREAMGNVSQSDVRRAVRDARHGRVPDDPEARRAAYRLLSTQVGQLRRQRRWAPAFLLLMIAIGVLLAVTQSPWWWVAVPIWVGALTLHLVLPRRMDRQLDLLRTD
jgi:Flp pilus assembly protein TadB